MRYSTDGRNKYKVLIGKPEVERGHFKNLGGDGSEILKFIKNKWNWSVWTGFIWLLRIGTCVRLLRTW
jgi:hypothetical protein